MSYTREARFVLQGPRDKCVQYIRPARVLTEQAVLALDRGTGIGSIVRRRVYDSGAWIKVQIPYGSLPIITINTVDEVEDVPRIERAGGSIVETNSCLRKHYVVCPEDTGALLLWVNNTVVVSDFEDPPPVTNAATATVQVYFTEGQEGVAWVPPDQLPGEHSTVKVIDTAAIQTEQGWFLLQAREAESTCSIEGYRRQPTMVDTVAIQESNFCTREFFPEKTVLTPSGLAITYKQCKKIKLVSSQGDVYELVFDEHKTAEECGL